MFGEIESSIIDSIVECDGVNENILLVQRFHGVELLTISELDELRKQVIKTLLFYIKIGLETDSDVKEKNETDIKKAREEERKRLIEKMNADKLDRDKKRDHLYVLLDKDNNSVKVGRSQNPKSRLKAISTSSSNEVELLSTYDYVGFLEEEIHTRLKKAGLHIRSEWFVNDPKTFEIITKTIEENE